MLYSGVILDQYDDTEQLLLKETFGSAQNAPQQLKTASADVTHLPDEVFALIVEEGGQRYRKYAMADVNTAIQSAFYFMKCGGKLPTEAQKVAAVNLNHALLQFQVRPPLQLQAMAKSAAIPKGLLDWSQDRIVGKESANTMNLSAKPAKKKTAASRVNAKVANVVDTTGQTAPNIPIPMPSPIRPSMYALEKEGSYMYPIDTMDRFLDAVDYFGKHEKLFSPTDRQAYCTKVAARAEQFGFELPMQMKHYASRQKSASAVEVAFYKRRQAIPESSGLQLLLSEVEKKAHHIAPSMLVAVLTEFDKEAGISDLWDYHIPNPILSVYKAAESADADDVLWAEGNDRISSAQLENFVRDMSARKLLEQKFSTDMVNKFIEDPVTIFKSLPDPHKIEIARLATQNSGGRDLPHRVVNPFSENP